MVEFYEQWEEHKKKPGTISKFYESLQDFLKTDHNAEVYYGWMPLSEVDEEGEGLEREKITEFLDGTSRKSTPVMIISPNRDGAVVVFRYQNVKTPKENITKVQFPDGKKIGLRGVDLRAFKEMLRADPHIDIIEIDD
jgi:hypothetical protein